MYTVVIGTDSSGSFPMVLHDEDELQGSSARWRLVGQTDDLAEAARLAQEAHERCYGAGSQA